MSTVIQEASRLNGTSSMSARTDEDLLLTYRETQDRDLFEELVRRYERELFSYLRRYVGDAEMAADVFQATFLQLHLKCSQFQEGRRLRPWLYTIATNQAIDAQRRNRRHRLVSLDTASSNSNQDVVKLLDLMASNELGPDERLGLEEDRSWVRQAVLDLPEHLRCVVALVYYQGLKYREAAEALDIPVGTVKSRMHTALLKLNEVFQDSQVRSK
jgi:RNA polymerase sigma-70 factor (ECF subfamily)